jgi:LAO/AO transport system kinase
VVNKSDRPEADTFAKHIGLLAHSSKKDIPVIKTIASQRSGLQELSGAIDKRLGGNEDQDRKYWLLAERAYQLIRNERMKNISKEDLKKNIKAAIHEGKFNLYSFAGKYQS